MIEVFQDFRSGEGHALRGQARALVDRALGVELGGHLGAADQLRLDPGRLAGGVQLAVGFLAGAEDHVVDAIGLPEECAPVVVWLASDAGGEVSGQAIGIGGDKLTLYSHPGEDAVAYREGGWTPEEVVRAWNERLSVDRQAYGIDLPDLYQPA